MNLTINQSKLLHALLDKYENSKTYEGTNAVSQNFAVKPEKVWKDYVSDYASVAQVKDFETEMQVLEEQGLVHIDRKNGVITKVVACKEKLDAYYELLGRKQRKDIVQEQIAFFGGQFDHVDHTGSTPFQRAQGAAKYKTARRHPFGRCASCTGF